MSAVASRRHYVAIFLIALATIAVQILFGRIFSVTFYYHFSFACITFAMLGLTAGALIVYEKDALPAFRSTDHAIARHALCFALALTLALILHMYIPGLIVQFFQKPWTGLLVRTSIGASIAALMGAFIYSGVCIALLLTRFPGRTYTLYAFDLTGAALGCILIIVVLKFVDPAGALLMIALLGAWVAWKLAAPADAALKKRAQYASLVLAVLSVVQIASYSLHTPFFRVSMAKNFGDDFVPTPIFERWNTYSRVHVEEYPGPHPFGWGFAREPQVNIAQKKLAIDADAGTIITAFDGDTKKVNYLQEDIINLGYHIRPMDRVAVIGVGGGRDILSALVFGATHIQGIELNPAIYEALTNNFGEFSGHLDQRPEVALASAEARSYLQSHPDRYDLIQISLIDTWAATAAGGLTLSENKLYTTDAWQNFLDRLNEHGMLVVSRWYNETTHPGEFYRLVAIAHDAIKSRHPEANPREHILAAAAQKPEDNSTFVVTVAVSQSPFTPAEIARFEQTCRRLHFIPLLTPHYAHQPFAASIASGDAGPDAFASFPLDVTASTDDRPFFFHMIRLASLLKSVPPQEGSHHYAQMNNEGLAMMLGLFVVVLVAGVFFIAMPMFRMYRQHHIPVARTFPYMLYFGAIGLGFMMVEVSQMQRLMIFLGHPVYGLSVVLFTLLLASGIGSSLRRDATQPLWQRPALLIVALIVTGLLTPLVTDHLQYYGTQIRIIASSLLLMPIGLCMGMMFPLGVALLDDNQRHLLPWYWGINGAASVLASVGAVLLSLQFGISRTFWIGVACYALCLAITLSLQHTRRRHNEMLGAPR